MHHFSPPVPEACAACLQGLLTKDVTPLGKRAAAPLYAAMLNAKGRVVHDLLLHRDESAAAAVWLDCPAPAAESLRNNLTRFKLRADVAVEDAREGVAVVARWSYGQPSLSDVRLPEPPGAHCPACATLVWNASPCAASMSTQHRPVRPVLAC